MRPRDYQHDSGDDAVDVNLDALVDRPPGGDVNDLCDDPMATDPDDAEEEEEDTVWLEPVRRRKRRHGHR